MKNIIKFIGMVAGIVTASVVIDKIIDKVCDSVAEEHKDCTNVENKSADIDVPASAYKTVVKAVAGAAVLIIINKYTVKKACDVAFKYGVEGGIRCATSAFVDFGISKESGRLLLTDTNTLISFRDKVLPMVKQAYFG